MAKMVNRNTIKAAQRGDNEMFDEIVKQYLPLIFRYLLRLTSSPRDAEDLVQETFIRAWKNIRRFNLEKPLRPWLLRIARNIAYDLLRRRKVFSFSSLSEIEQYKISLISDEGLSLQEKAERNEKIILVARIFAKLTDADREILVLRYFEDLTVKEIAVVLNLPYETVRTRLRRARVAFRNSGKCIIEPDQAPSSVLQSKDGKKQTPKSSATITLASRPLYP